MSTEGRPYKRVLLKLSGEALMGDDEFGIHRETLQGMVKQIAEALSLGTELAIVKKKERSE